MLYHYSWFTELYLASIRCFTGGDTENKDSSSRVEVTEARFTKNYTTLQTLKWTLNSTPWNCFPTNLLQWTQTFFLPLTFTMKWEPVFGEESANSSILRRFTEWRAKDTDKNPPINCLANLTLVEIQYI